MRRLVKLPTWLWIALVSSLGAPAMAADISGNPYLGIAGRNIFGLNPPRPLIIEPPSPKVKLFGITTFGDKRALLKVYLPAKPPEPAKELACILKVGQREGPIEVLDINERAGTVRVMNFRTVIVLTFEKETLRPQNPPPLSDPPPLPVQSASR